MKARKLFASLFALGCMLAISLPAVAQGMEFSFEGPRLNSVILGGIPLPTGADVEFRFPIKDSGLFFTLELGAGYEDRFILRMADGTPIAKPEDFDAGDQKQWFYWPNVAADAGLVYRLGAGDGAPVVELFGLARGRGEINSPSLSTAVFPDAQNLLALSFLAGVGVDEVEKNPRRFKSGYSGEISFEYAPSFLAFAGSTDFFRASANIEGYLPIFSVGASDLNAVSLYAGGYLTADAAAGSAIPLYILTSFGGRELRDGLGSSIRGYRSWGYEAALKAEASFDLRLVGPGLFGVASLRPMAYAFGDSGWYGGLYKSPDVATGGDKDGWIVSAGGGLALGVLDFAYMGLRAGWKFPIDDPLYATYFGSEKFFWGITFLLHF